MEWFDFLMVVEGCSPVRLNQNASASLGSICLILNTLQANALSTRERMLVLEPAVNALMSFQILDRQAGSIQFRLPPFRRTDNVVCERIKPTGLLRRTASLAGLPRRSETTFLTNS